MNNRTSRENKMGIMPVNQLLISMSVPIMISMLVQALYNIVDSMFVARLSEEALTAVSLSFPMQNLMIAVCTGTGVGVNALVSRSLGEGDFEKANRFANTGLYLALFSSLVFVALSLLLGHTFFTVQTDVKTIVDYGTQYLHIVGGLSIGLFFQIMLERLLQSTGRTIYSMITQTTGALLNIILDPILIFGLFGLPRLEVQGAALATVIGQCAAALLGLFLNRKINTELTLSPLRFPPAAKYVKQIYAIGVPSIFMVSIGSIMNFFFNKLLLAYSTTAAAVFGVYFKLQSFVFMPIFGLNNGMVPIIGYNYGAQKPSRIMKTLRLAILYAFIIMFLGTLVFELKPDALLGIFSASDHMLEIGVPALRIIATHFCIAAFSIICSSLFQALGHSNLSLITSLIRQLLVLLPCAWLLSTLGGLKAIWWSFPIAEAVAFLLNVHFLRRVYALRIRPMEKANTERKKDSLS